MTRLERILSKSPTWTRLRVVLQDEIEREYSCVGRRMVLKDGTHILEGAHNVHTVIHVVMA